ncbi:4'-phosphopantetheinyl transferase family protein [Aquimarina sp. 2201CG14-23]|uniref:4'-phosphopantetheinyl transferase family protein n=1 Tax=Aquimarina mycalae TaxID=3040073 RepID=UPI0024781A0A|nr:4'-phosphopantetheinyl transferase superfamily protein [Aquimarina sp. 2201CG14-23]MDH7446445.1 4'-phosphopantetheinyl transferase superfamily protein [Aquimarina sp. 2201CG14-23]
MIGNDIVDFNLASIQSNWRRKGWLQKICTSSEQSMIHTAQNPNQMVWKLWSMKEATYKAHQRRFSVSPKYNPKDFICTNDIVTVDNYKYITSSWITKEYVHTIATCNYNQSYVYKILDNSALKYKSILKDCIADIFEIEESSIAIEKDRNHIPVISVNNLLLDTSISLSNHGRFSAFTINL